MDNVGPQILQHFQHLVIVPQQTERITGTRTKGNVGEDEHVLPRRTCLTKGPARLKVDICPTTCKRTHKKIHPAFTLAIIIMLLTCEAKPAGPVQASHCKA